MESADSTKPVDIDKLMRRIDMIDTEQMLLGKVWQAGEDKTVNGHSVCLTRTMELQNEREAIEAQLGYEVDNRWLTTEELW